MASKIPPVIVRKRQQLVGRTEKLAEFEKLVSHFERLQGQKTKVQEKIKISPSQAELWKGTNQNLEAQILLTANKIKAFRV